jgi:hypothetical protein
MCFSNVSVYNSVNITCTLLYTLTLLKHIPDYIIYIDIKKKGKPIPVTHHTDPQGCETSRLAHFLDSRPTDGI